jgi:hypothetical protein
VSRRRDLVQVSGPGGCLNVHAEYLGRSSATPGASGSSLSGSATGRGPEYLTAEGADTETSTYHYWLAASSVVTERFS